MEPGERGPDRSSSLCQEICQSETPHREGGLRNKNPSFFPFSLYFSVSCWASLQLTQPETKGPCGQWMQSLQVSLWDIELVWKGGEQSWWNEGKRAHHSSIHPTRLSWHCAMSYVLCYWYGDIIPGKTNMVHSFIHSSSGTFEAL